MSTECRLLGLKSWSPQIAVPLHSLNPRRLCDRRPLNGWKLEPIPSFGTLVQAFRTVQNEDVDGFSRMHDPQSPGTCPLQ